MRNSLTAALCGLALLAAACGGSKKTTPPPSGPKCWDATANAPKANCTCSDDTDCSTDTTKYICDTYSTCQQICQTNADCTSPQVCDLGQCVNPSCSTTADCSAGQMCLGGKCGAPPAPASCVIEPARPYVNTGGTTQLSVQARDSAGNLSPTLPGDWTWAVSGGGATVDSTGLVTGTAQGTPTVTATHKSGTSCSVAVTASAAFTDTTKTRVTVIDEQNGLPVNGATVEATVMASGNALDTQTTDTSGIATLNMASGAGNLVSVFAADYDWISIAEPTSHDLFIPVRRKIPANTGGGYKGAYTTYNTDGTVKQTSVPTSQLRLGIAGTSVPGSLIDLNLNVLVGPTIPTKIAVANNKIVPIPSGIALGLGTDWYTSVTQGTAGSTTAADGTFGALGVPGECNCAASDSACLAAEAAGTCGVRSAWGLAGTVDTNVALNAIGSGSNIDIGAVIGQLLPYFEKFRSVVKTNVPFKTMAYQQVPDPTNPSNTLNLPQFKDNTAFPSKTDTFADPSQFYRLALNPYVKVPTLPQYCPAGSPVAGGGCPCTASADCGAGGACDTATGVCTAGTQPLPQYVAGALVLGGAIVPQQGLVGLGLTAGVDKASSTDQPNGVVNDKGDETGAAGVLSLRLAPEHSGIEGNPYAALALAVDFSSLSGGKARLATSGLVSFWTSADQVQAKHVYDFGGQSFLGFADGAAVSGSRVFTPGGSSPTGAVLRARFHNGEGNWFVYYASAAPITMPAAPGGLNDRLYNAADTAHGNAPWPDTLSQAMVLKNGSTSLTYNDLFNFGGTTADRLVYYVTAFSAIQTQQ